MGLTPLDSTSGSKSQNIEFFGTDIKMSDSGWLVINVSGTAVLLQITKDSGTTWTNLGTLIVNQDTMFSTSVRTGDLINFRTDNVLGIDVDYIRIDFSQLPV